jgi:hypothetical protein
MKTNDIKKGMRIQLACGWFGTMYDNKKGNIRMAEVEGFCTEIGSVYAHDIRMVLVDGRWKAVEHTPEQMALSKRVAEMGY